MHFKTETMRTPIKILLTTDYSENSRSAERYAIQFAIQCNSSLEILHVFDPPLKTTSIPGVFDVEKIDYSPAHYELKKLKDHIAKICSGLNVLPGDLTYECVVREGSASVQVPKEAKESGADLIMLGSHDNSGISQFFYGNHTWNIMKNSEIPVLAIPSNAHFTGIKNLTYVTEYRESELRVIDFLSRLVSGFHAEINVLHMRDKDVSPEYDQETFVAFNEKLKDRTKYPNITTHTLETDDMTESLNDFCSTHHADWVAISIEKTGLLERLFSLDSAAITKKMTFHSQVPFLVLHDKYVNGSPKEMPLEKTLELKWDDF